MQIKITNVILATIAAILFVGTFTFTSCNKEEGEHSCSTQLNSNISEKLLSEERICIGYVEKEEIHYLFDIEELSEVLYNMESMYTVENFEILDSTSTGGIVEAYIVLYNVEEEVTESLWIPIEKEGDKFYFSKEEKPDLGDRIRCKASKDCERGCIRERENGKFLGCKCIGEDGEKGGCFEKELIVDIIDSLGDALAKVITALDGLI